MKSISIMRRRPGMSREKFLRHYEDVHAPMGYTHYRFDKYVRNYVDGEVFGSFGYDVIAEFYPDLSQPWPQVSGEILQAFADDRALFMDGARLGGSVDERIALGGPREIDPEGLQKLCVFARGEADPIVGDFMHGSHAGRLRRITVDVFQQSAPDRPFDALIWIWADHFSDELLGGLQGAPGIHAIVTARSYETPAELLKAHA